MYRIRTIVFLSLIAFLGFNLEAQPLKPRPDAFPPLDEAKSTKSIQMAATVEQMASWDRYPTYNTYIAMMQQWASQYPDLCKLDTIGLSVKGRLILCMHIQAHLDLPEAANAPQFLYSSTMHGDEVTGYVMMLRLIDTLLRGYGNNPQYTNLVDNVAIYINPLSNPDGTYRGGNNTISSAMRYNANYVDLNRNYPDPFGTQPLSAEQPENTAMIAYLGSHQFRLSANLHGGSEVMNYPWDSFTSYERPHPDRQWWIEVSKRFVDTSRLYSQSHFRDVNSVGYIEGGDWYVISNGRQDYVNYYHNCHEMTMEISTDKTIDGEQLPEYWRFLQHSFVNYIEEVFSVPATAGIENYEETTALDVFPNPAADRIFIRGNVNAEMRLYDAHGKELPVVKTDANSIYLGDLPQGLYLLRAGTRTAKIVKR
ncbi:MAG: T9SS type A sorting domain-containing protein [Bacteroidales bacterium]|nr:T9SS type A sorting domain-containing protein [Bacteroidales bacterium]